MSSSGDVSMYAFACAYFVICTKLHKYMLVYILRLNLVAAEEAGAAKPIYMCSICE